MQQPSTPAPSPTAASFAGLLAALASPAPKPLPEPWSDDDLADDVATLSYENALRTHARYRAAGPSNGAASLSYSDQSLTQIPDPEPIRRIQGPLGDEFEAAAPQAELRTAPIAAPRQDASAQPEPEVNPFHAAQLERNLKDASITIRMSHTESEQLRLTVSAYLRSCTFEVESLRAMVKDTVAQLRTAKATQKIADDQPARAGWFRSITRWLSRLLTPWQDARRVARA
jgi:hypothetical protein